MIFSLQRKPQELIKFYVTRQLKKEAVQLAEERGISLSALLRLMLSEYIKHKR